MTLYCGLSAHCNQHEVSWEHGGRAPILGLSGVWGSPDGAVLGQVDRIAAEPEGSTDFPHAALTSLGGRGECRPLPARDSFHSVAPLTAASHAPSHATATPPPSMKRKAQGSSQNGCLRRCRQPGFQFCLFIESTGLGDQRAHCTRIIQGPRILTQCPKTTSQKSSNFLLTIQ